MKVPTTRAERCSDRRDNYAYRGFPCRRLRLQQDANIWRRSSFLTCSGFLLDNARLPRRDTFSPFRVLTTALATLATPRPKRKLWGVQSKHELLKRIRRERRRTREMNRVDARGGESGVPLGHHAKKTDRDIQPVESRVRLRSHRKIDNHAPAQCDAWHVGG